MTPAPGPSMSSEPAAPEQPEAAVVTARRTGWRRFVAPVALVVVLAAAAWVLVGRRHELARAADLVGWPLLVVGVVPAVLGTALTGVSWWRVVRGLGVPAPLVPALRVFYVTQLGKYLPGSVWPALGQMAAAKQWGRSPRTLLSANLQALLVSLVTGLVVAVATLPWSAADALSRYWWALLALPFLLALLAPRVLPAVLDRIAVLLKRPALGERLPARATAESALWSVGTWVLLGLQTWTVCHAAAGGGDGFRLVVAAVGATALGMCAGVLAVPVPAGAAVREAVLVLALTASLPLGAALLVAVAVRLQLVVADLVLALVGWLGSRGKVVGA